VERLAGGAGAARRSLRAARPFVEVNCAAIPEELIESELFGHRKGAYTGAAEDKRGKFHLADGGTLFLDEVGDMSLRTQAKVLRVLDEQRFTPIGAPASVRSTPASSLPPTRTSRKRSTANAREDLFYRLNAIPFRPPRSS
jgi:two-component system nitrogen regulation response regulator NtrX